MTADYPDWGALQAMQTFITDLNLASQTLQATAAQIADEISDTGTPLLHGTAILDAHTAYTVAAESYESPFYTFQKPGYNITVSASISGSATIPFIRARMIWWATTAGADQIAEEDWYIPATSSGTVNIYGKGPVKGQALTLQLYNYDPSYTATVTVDLLNTTQHIARDDWRTDRPASVPGFTAAPADPFAGVLALASVVSLGAGDTSTLLLPLYAGAALLNVTQSGGRSVTVNVYPLDPQVGITVTPPVYTITTTDDAIGPVLLVLPRCPCILQFTNHGTSGTNISYTMQVLEYAS